MSSLLPYLWAFPTTLVGLALTALALATGGHAAIVTGVLEVHGGLITPLLRHATLLPGGASAMTLGHVVLAQDALLLDLTRPHERIHVRQAERWGPLFLPAYLGIALYLLLRHRHPYLDHPFEREAYAMGK